MTKPKIRRKPEAQRKKRALTVWLDDEQGAALDRACGGFPLSTWARVELLKIAMPAAAK